MCIRDSCPTVNCNSVYLCQVFCKIVGLILGVGALVGAREHDVTETNSGCNYSMVGIHITLLLT